MKQSKTAWLSLWQIAFATEQSEQLVNLLKDLPDLLDEERLTVLGQALEVAGSLKRISLLTITFQYLDNLPVLRATALELTLELADERDAAFRALLESLSNGEQVLLMAHLLERCRQDEDVERQLFRLSLILELIPQDVRSLYWNEAQELALLGGDDAQLLLLKLAHHLSNNARRSTFEELAEAVSRLKEPFKLAQASALLIELGVPLALLDSKRILETARSIPDPVLRVATKSRLEALLGSRL